MSSNVKKMTATAMLCAIAYIMTYIARVPVVLFLKYDPKDIIITLGGLIWGPLSAFTVSVIVSVLEMLTNSSTGIWGCIMNIISSCSFACVVAIVYKRKRTIAGAVAGLVIGVAAMCAVMMLWNYLITPLYMGLPREEIVKLLLPAFLPFNLIKGGLNAALTFFLYKPVITALRKTGYIEAGTSSTQGQYKKPVGLWILCAAVIITCILLIMSMNGVI